MPPHTTMQVSVVLPPLLMEGLLENYMAVFGKTTTFTSLALYALNELWADLADEAALTSAGILLPSFDPSYTASVGRHERRAAHGFYSLKVPEDFRPKWEGLLRAHHNNGPAVVYRAMLSLYRATRQYYIENEKNTTFPDKYPAL